MSFFRTLGDTVDSVIEDHSPLPLTGVYFHVSRRINLPLDDCIGEINHYLDLVSTNSFAWLYEE